MAAFDVNIKNGLTALATAIKANRLKIGDLASLATTAKSDLVSAINEVRGMIGSGSIAEIDDGAASNSTSKTYSANKITQISQAIKSDILGGASSAYDTLLELQQFLQADDTSISAILTALTKRVRVDAVQTFNSTELQQGRDNLSVYSKAEIGDVNHDYVADVNTALA